MTRLIDTILGTGGLHTGPLKPAIAALVPGLLRALAHTEVVVTDNVTQYFFAGTPQEHWDLARDFPNSAPPWPSFWMESRAPTHILSAEHGTLAWGPRTAAWGLLFQDEPIPDAAIIRQRFPFGLDDPTQLRWLLAITVIIQAAKGQVPIPILTWFVPVREHGGIIPSEGHSPAPFVSLTRAPDPMEIELELRPLLSAALLALSLIHCRNVERRLVTPDAALTRARQRRGKRPLVSYHVLEIGPMTRVLEGEGGARRHGLPKALHICRGHFKTYTPDKPLLGRATGTFWWGMHLRGDPGAGLALKDYAVNPPEGA